MEKLKLIFNERGVNLDKAPPATPVSILGLDGAPQAGDSFLVLDDEREAKQIAAKEHNFFVNKMYEHKDILLLMK